MNLIFVFFLAWEQIYSKLLPLMEEHKAAVTKKEKRDRHNLRLGEFQFFWKEYLASILDKTRYRVIALCQDVCDMPVISEMLLENDATIPVTMERWLSVADSVPSILADFQTKFQNDLVKRLHPSGEYTTSDTGINERDLHILNLATSVFRCFCCDACLSYPAGFEHEHIQPASRGWSQTLHCFYKSEEMESIVRSI